MRVILPGSYDPVTLGHLDVIRRAAKEYGEVYVVIFTNPDKTYTYELSDRVRMLMIACDEFENVLVSHSNGYVIDYMREHDIDKIIKGYRTEADLSYERVQAEWNLSHGGYETELWQADERYSHISSTLARKMLAEGQRPTGILPEGVIDYIREKF